jgi:hypothetical protein
MKKIVTTTPDPEFNIPDNESKEEQGKQKEPPPRPPGVGCGTMQEEPAPEELTNSADTRTQQGKSRTPDKDR